MFERFTEEARQVVVLAQEEARKLKHNYIGTEHLLLGIAREQSGTAAQILSRCGLDLDAIRARIVEIVGPGEEATSGQIPFTPRARHALERAARESGDRDQAVGPAHLLLGVLQRDSVAMRVIADAGAEEQLVAEVRAALDAEGIPYDVHVVQSARRRRHMEGTYVGGSIRAPIGDAAPSDEVVALARRAEWSALTAAALIVTAALVAVAVLDAARGSQAAIEAAVLAASAWGPASLLVAVAIARTLTGDRYRDLEEEPGLAPLAVLALAAAGLAVAGIAVNATALTIALGLAAAAIAVAAATRASSA